MDASNILKPAIDRTYVAKSRVLARLREEVESLERMQES